MEWVSFFSILYISHGFVPAHCKHIIAEDVHAVKGLILATNSANYKLRLTSQSHECPLYNSRVVMFHCAVLI